MKKIISIFVVLATCLALVACKVTLPEGVTQDEISAASQQVIDYLNAKNYDALGEMYTQTLATALEADKLAEIWEPILDELGAFEKIEKQNLQVKDNMTVATILAKYTNKSIVYTFAYTTDYKLDGLFMK